MNPRRAFILPVALAIAAFIAATVIFCAGLIRRNLAEPERALAMARSQALYGLDVALAQLQAAASADTTATAQANILTNSPNASWTGAWAKGNDTPTWLVSGENVNPNTTDGANVTETLKAPLVTTSTGAYAYVVEDISTKVTRKIDRLPDIPSGLGENTQRLQQQTIFVPQVAALNDSQTTPISYGLLTNPTSGGWKIDADATSSTDDISTQIKNWRAGQDLIRSRPIIWAEAAALMGVYKNGAGVPQLGLAFWADIWNPYTLSLIFNAKSIPDMRLRLEGPSGTLKYYNVSGQLVGFERLDIAAHTSASPVMTDLYGPMSTGEIRFITHYRVEPLAPDAPSDYPDAMRIEVNIPSGEWNFVFETLDGQPVQKITGIPFDAISRTFDYQSISPDKLDSKSCQWVYSFKLREPITAMLAQIDPRGREVKFSSAFYIHDADPVHAQTNFNSFSGGDAYRDGQVVKLFDLPEGSLVSAGALQHIAMENTPALALGSSAAGTSNTIFDTHFFSSVPADASAWGSWSPGAGTTLPNANLRLTGAPDFNTLKQNAAANLLVQGAFNINTADANEWLAILPKERYPFPFRLDVVSQPTQILESERQAWAQAIVSRLKARAKPWHSLQDLANENILPPDVFCRISSLLQPRGDTFRIHVYATARQAHSSLEAWVQRLPTPDGNGRRFQVLSVRWLNPPAQN